MNESFDTISNLRINLSGIKNRVDLGETVIITHYNEPTMVVLTPREYDRLKRLSLNASEDDDTPLFSFSSDLIASKDFKYDPRSRGSVDEMGRLPVIEIYRVRNRFNALKARNRIYEFEETIVNKYNISVEYADELVKDLMWDTTCPYPRPIMRSDLDEDGRVKRSGRKAKQFEAQDVELAGRLFRTAQQLGTLYGIISRIATRFNLNPPQAIKILQAAGIPEEEIEAARSTTKSGKAPRKKKNMTKKAKALAS